MRRLTFKTYGWKVLKVFRHPFIRIYHYKLYYSYCILFHVKLIYAQQMRTNKLNISKKDKSTVLILKLLVAMYLNAVRRQRRLECKVFYTRFATLNSNCHTTHETSS